MIAKTTDLTRMARWFYALSDETRLRVVGLLASGEKCVCELQGVTGAAQSRMSFHLRVLRDAGLVNDRRDGRWVRYSLRPEVLEEISGFVQEHTPAPAGWTSPSCDSRARDGAACG